jgi:hypothetical protein
MVGVDWAVLACKNLALKGLIDRGQDGFNLFKMVPDSDVFIYKMSISRTSL